MRQTITQSSQSSTPDTEEAAVVRAAEAAWAATPALRAEFGNNKAWFIAYRKAEARGKIRILGGPPSMFPARNPGSR